MNQKTALRTDVRTLRFEDGVFEALYKGARIVAASANDRDPPSIKVSDDQIKVFCALSGANLHLLQQTCSSSHKLTPVLDIDIVHLYLTPRANAPVLLLPKFKAKNGQIRAIGTLTLLSEHHHVQFTELVMNNLCVHLSLRWGKKVLYARWFRSMGANFTGSADTTTVVTASSAATTAVIGPSPYNNSTATAAKSASGSGNSSISNSIAPITSGVASAARYIKTRSRSLSHSAMAAANGNPSGSGSASASNARTMLGGVSTSSGSAGSASNQDPPFAFLAIYDTTLEIRESPYMPLDEKEDKKRRFATEIQLTTISHVKEHRDYVNCIITLPGKTSPRTYQLYTQDDAVKDRLLMAWRQSFHLYLLFNQQVFSLELNKRKVQLAMNFQTQITIFDTATNKIIARSNIQHLVAVKDDPKDDRMFTVTLGVAGDSQLTKVDFVLRASTRAARHGLTLAMQSTWKYTMKSYNAMIAVLRKEPWFRFDIKDFTDVEKELQGLHAENKLQYNFIVRSNFSGGSMYNLSLTILRLEDGAIRTFRITNAYHCFVVEKESYPTMHHLLCALNLRPLVHEEREYKMWCTYPSLICESPGKLAEKRDEAEPNFDSLYALLERTSIELDRPACLQISERSDRETAEHIEALVKDQLVGLQQPLGRTITGKDSETSIASTLDGSMAMVSLKSNGGSRFNLVPKPMAYARPSTEDTYQQFNDALEFSASHFPDLSDLQ